MTFCSESEIKFNVYKVVVVLVERPIVNEGIFSSEFDVLREEVVHTDLIHCL